MELNIFEEAAKGPGIHDASIGEVVKASVSFNLDPHSVQEAIQNFGTKMMSAYATAAKYH
jgi:hypothetical protein